MKIGIFGGTFNPIHVGHAIIASYLAQNCGLDRVWLMVSPLSPFKQDKGEQLDADRLRMTEMVSKKLTNVITSGFEFSLPRPSYTVDTLRALKEKFPDDEFVLIIGADNWDAFNRWAGHEEIIKNHEIFIYPRQGYDVVIPIELQKTVKLVSAPLIEVSSTRIRDGIKNFENMSFYLPEDIYNYILRHKLYQV